MRYPVLIYNGTCKYFFFANARNTLALLLHFTPGDLAYSPYSVFHLCPVIGYTPGSTGALQAFPTLRAPGRVSRGVSPMLY